MYGYKADTNPTSISKFGRDVVVNAYFANAFKIVNIFAGINNINNVSYCSHVGIQCDNPTYICK